MLENDKEILGDDFHRVRKLSPPSKGRTKLINRGDHGNRISPASSTDSEKEVRQARNEFLHHSRNRQPIIQINPEMLAARNPYYVTMPGNPIMVPNLHYYSYMN